MKHWIKFKVGQIVKGQVTKCVEYGAFIRIAEGLKAFVTMWIGQKKFQIQIKFYLHLKRYQ